MIEIASQIGEGVYRSTGGIYIAQTPDGMIPVGISLGSGRAPHLWYERITPDGASVPMQLSVYGRLAEFIRKDLAPLGSRSEHSFYENGFKPRSIPETTEVSIPSPEPIKFPQRIREDVRLPSNRRISPGVSQKESAA